jgi:hypothetical protein
VETGDILALLKMTAIRVFGNRNPIRYERRCDMILTGTTRDGVVVLDEGQTLPDGIKVQIKVQVLAPSGDQKPTLAERLLCHAGTVPGLPADMAKNHDHYAHGAPQAVLV